MTLVILRRSMISVLRSEAVSHVILRSEATKNLLRFYSTGSRSFAALRMTWE
jgi:hypothetical protein